MGWGERLGSAGVWRGVNAVDAAMARSIEELGYRTVWQGSSPGSDLRPAEGLLDATESLVVATGIVNIWQSDAAELADSYHRIQAKHPGRLLLGIGTGHREAVARKVPSTSVARVHGAITAAARGRADRQERGVVVPVALEVVCQAAVSGPGAPMAALTVSCCSAVASKVPASLWSPAV